jgi:hypothetical protein
LDKIISAIASSSELITLESLHFSFALCNTLKPSLCRFDCYLSQNKKSLPETNTNVPAGRKHFQVRVTHTVYWLKWKLHHQTTYKKWYVFVVLPCSCATVVGCGSLDKSPCPVMVRYTSKRFKTGQKSHECGNGQTRNQCLRNSFICSAHNSDNNNKLNCIDMVAFSPVIWFFVFSSCGFFNFYVFPLFTL